MARRGRQCRSWRVSDRAHRARALIPSLLPEGEGTNARERGEEGGTGQAEGGLTGRHDPPYTEGLRATTRRLWVKSTPK
jgi:hypothetical protein